MHIGIADNLLAISYPNDIAGSIGWRHEAVPTTTIYILQFPLKHLLDLFKAQTLEGMHQNQRDANKEHDMTERSDYSDTQH